jgi:hypothetical protein
MAIYVGAWSRAPRAWSDLVASDSGGFRAGGSWAVVAYAGRVAEPLRLAACEYVQTMLPGRMFQIHPGVPSARLIGFDLVHCTQMTSQLSMSVVNLV